MVPEGHEDGNGRLIEVSVEAVQVHTDLLQGAANSEQVHGIGVEDGENGILTDPHLHVSHDHPNQPLLKGRGAVHHVHSKGRGAVHHVHSKGRGAVHHVHSKGRGAVHHVHSKGRGAVHHVHSGGVVGGADLLKGTSVSKEDLEGCLHVTTLSLGVCHSNIVKVTVDLQEIQAEQ